ncbi:MAG: hypothetical protein JSV26_07595 [bacterium]|nr:MAG: hypothetical protein JSV26_07595 [bacterium]
MAQEIQERVVVGAVFGAGGKMRPAWFIWRKRRYRISGITFSWSERRGSAILHHFTVTDGSDLYELVLDGEALTWYLEKVAQLV